MSKFRKFVKPLTWAAVIGGASAIVVLETVPKFNEFRRSKALLSRPPVPPEDIQRFSKPLPPREHHIKRMSSGEDFDVLVIGGGATGTGVAVDAASRGLSTCLIERDDFASGTSSRSTKLIHGGVRYLEKAFFNLDLEQLRMVNDALSERANLIDIAPHLAYPLPILLPIYKLWQLPYFWAGIKLYDLISGKQILKSSYIMGKTRVLENFPLLKKDKLVGGLVYYDGQHEDARMCLCLALTAARYGATVGNYVECLSLTKAPDGSVNGAVVRDNMTGREIKLKARCIINATGPFTDAVRQMDDAKQRAICQPSSGVHIMLPGYFTPSKMGLLDPQTSDGRLIFFLPWLNFSLAGTTDTPSSVTDHPSPSEGEVDFIVNEIRSYMSPEVRIQRGDVLSAWSGIRPLIQDPKSTDTQSIARNHIIDIAPSKLITIAGGKWTTYRSMAEETIDKAIEVCKLPTNQPCQTKGLLLEGAHAWFPNLYIRLVQEYGLDVDVAKHLTTVYGDKAIEVANRAHLTGSRWPVMGKRLHPDFPFIEAEVSWACQEYACRLIDFVSRRTRMAFLNIMVTRDILPRVAELMAKELNWSSAKQKEEIDHALSILNVEMALPTIDNKSICSVLTSSELTSLTEEFKRFDQGSKGYISVADLDKLCKRSGHELSPVNLKALISYADRNKNEQIELNEFLLFMDAVKSGEITQSPLLRVFHPVREVNVDRSGGGV